MDTSSRPFYYKSHRVGNININWYGPTDNNKTTDST